MAFWKKSEDPWDIAPDQRRTASEPAEKAPGLLDTLRGDWDAMRELGKGAREFFGMEEKAPEPEVPPQMCPWCGKDMEQGFLMGGRGVAWHRGIPTGKARWLSPGRENIMRVDTEGFLTTYHTAWYCPDCKKMTIDAADLQTEAERNQAAFPVGAEETASQSDEAKEGE